MKNSSGMFTGENGALEVWDLSMSAVYRFRALGFGNSHFIDHPTLISHWIRPFANFILPFALICPTNIPRKALALTAALRGTCRGRLSFFSKYAAAVIFVSEFILLKNLSARCSWVNSKNGIKQVWAIEV